MLLDLSFDCGTLTIKLIFLQAAAHVVQPTAANVPLAVCAKRRPVTQAAANEAHNQNSGLCVMRFSPS